MRDETQLVGAGDEGADEAQVDEGDEESVRFRAVVGEEREDGPGSGEDRDDEEDEDVVGCQGIVGGVNVDKPGEHAESRDL